MLPAMTWKQFVRQWRPVNLTRLKVPGSTVFAWRDGSKEPKDYHRDALEFWIEAKAGEKTEPENDAAGKGSDSF